MCCNSCNGCNGCGCCGHDVEEVNFNKFQELVLDELSFYVGKENTEEVRDEINNKLRVLLMEFVLHVGKIYIKRGNTVKYLVSVTYEDGGYIVPKYYTKLE